MPTGAENLETALAGVRTKLAEVLASPTPNYSIDGQSVDRMSYYKMLLDSEKMLVEAVIRAQGPYEVVVHGRP